MPLFFKDGFTILQVALNNDNRSGLTVCDAGQGLVEGGRVAVVGERDTHSSGQKPSGQSEGLLVL